MQQQMPYEGSGDISGNISLKFREGHSIITLCEKIFPGFHADDHEPIAIRLFYGKETILTMYALDKVRQETGSTNTGKLPVRKFKKELESLAILLVFAEEINFTLSAGNFPLEDMEVINK